MKSSHQQNDTTIIDNMTSTSYSTTVNYFEGFDNDIKRFDSFISNDTAITVVSSTSEDAKQSVISATYGAIISKDDEENIIIVEQPQCSTMGASVNLVNAMMGTGIIGLPLALHLCGFWLGLFFTMATAYLTCMTMHITIFCGIKTRTCSLVSLSHRLIGRAGSYVVNFIIFFHTAGTAVSYYILLGDTLPSLLALVFPNIPYLSNRRCVVLAFGLFCTLPLSLSRSTAKFAKWSAMSVGLLCLMLLGVMIRVPHYLSMVDKIELEVVPVSESMFKGLAIMSLSFGCAQNVFGVYSSIDDKRPSNWLFACSLATGTAFIVNIVFAVLAYLCFGKDVMANILLNFPENDPGIRLVKLALGLFMVLTIPLCIHPCRESVMMMCGFNINNPTNKQHYGVTIAVFAIILSIGATLTSLGRVFDVIGGFSSTILVFFLPGCAYIYLFSSDLFFSSSYNKKDCLLQEEDDAFKVKASWKFYLLSIISVIVSIPVMYFSIKGAIFE